MLFKVLLLCMATVVLVVISHLNFETFDDIRTYNFITESFIALVAAFFFLHSEKLRGKYYYKYISTGFFFTFIALVTDSLDQLYLHPEFYTAVAEKTFRLVGYALVFLGVSHWLKDYHELNEKLQEQLEMDVLTGLYNRQGIQNQVSLFHEKATKTGKKCTFAIIDIDNFKTVNDNFGHLVGDQILKKIGQKLSKLNNSHTKVGRWGGEEFTVVVSGMNLTDTVKFCEKICHDIEEMDLHEFLGEKNITFSIGVSEIKKDDSIRDFLARADKALYRSKKEGKNQVNFL